MGGFLPSTWLPRLTRPIFPPPHGVELFAQRRAGRFMAALVAPVGRPYDLSPSFGGNKIAMSSASGSGSTNITNLGHAAPTTSGTLTARNQATTSLLTSTRRIGMVIASAAANQMSGLAMNGNATGWWVGNAAGLGGFFFTARFGFNAFTGGAGGNRGFIGLSAAAWTTGDPSALVNMIGVGFDSGDTNFSVMANDGSGTATKTGTGIAVAQDKLYEARVFCAPSGLAIVVALERLDDATTYEQTVAADLPGATTFLLPQVKGNSGSSATTGAALEFISAYIESDF